MRSRVEELGPVVVDAVRAGLSLRDAAVQAGLPEPTVRGWAKKGRAGQSAFAWFAAALDEARYEAGEAVRRAGPLSREELFGVASEAARRGSVQAMKLVRDLLLDREADHGAVDSSDLLDVALAELDEGSG